MAREKMENALLLFWLVLLLIVVIIAPLALALAWVQIPVMDYTIWVLKQFYLRRINEWDHE